MLVTLLFLLALSLFTSEGGGNEMSFSDFQTAVADGRVQDATIHDADQTVTGDLEDGTGYTTSYPTEYADDLAGILQKAGVPTEVDPQKPNALLSTFITVLLPEFVVRHWWGNLLHNQNALLLKGRLLFRKGTVVTSVPYHLE